MLLAPWIFPANHQNIYRGYRQHPSLRNLDSASATQACASRLVAKLADERFPLITISARQMLPRFLKDAISSSHQVLNKYLA